MENHRYFFLYTKYYSRIEPCASSILDFLSLHSILFYTNAFMGSRAFIGPG